MSKQVIETPHAPAALGPYSQAIKAGNTVYVSGQIGFVPGTKAFVSADVEAQTEQVLKNLGAILTAAGADYKDVVKTTILLVSVGLFMQRHANPAGFALACGLSGHSSVTARVGARKHIADRWARII